MRIRYYMMGRIVARPPPTTVIPAQAGIPLHQPPRPYPIPSIPFIHAKIPKILFILSIGVKPPRRRIPACAGMTGTPGQNDG